MNDTPAFDNEYDENTTVMRPYSTPTYDFVLDLPNHSEIMVFFTDMRVEAFEIDEPFRENMREAVTAAGGSTRNIIDDVLMMVVVTPEKMNPNIVAALMTKRRS